MIENLWMAANSKRRRICDCGWMKSIHSFFFQFRTLFSVCLLILKVGLAPFVAMPQVGRTEFIIPFCLQCQINRILLSPFQVYWRRNNLNQIKAETVSQKVVIHSGDGSAVNPIVVLNLICHCAGLILSIHFGRLHTSWLWLHLALCLSAGSGARPSYRKPISFYFVLLETELLKCLNICLFWM